MRKHLIAAVILSCAVSAGATIINVPADQPTIQQGIDASQSGDTVLVAPGTYTENLVYQNRNIRLTSSGGAELTFLRPENSASPTVIFDGNVNRYAYFGGFTIENGGNVTTMHIVSTCQPVIADNIFRNNIPGGVINPLTVIQPDGAALITRNLIYDNGGINVIYCTGPAEIVNNTIVSNLRGIYAPNGSSVILNNIIANNDEYGLIESAQACDYNDVWNNGWENQGYNDPGPNGIIEDPLFIDEAAGDYTIPANSPCVDAGHPDFQYNDPDGTRNDIGAYPFYGLPPYASSANLGEEDPTCVIDHTPTFFWEYYDPIYPDQAAYEIQVGLDLDWTTAEMWASGPVTSPDQFAVYDGDALTDGTDYYCRIRVYNGSEWGGWSQMYFHMNSIPSIPTAKSPIDMVEITACAVRLTVYNAADFEQQSLTYDFEIAEASVPSMIVASEYDVIEQTDETASGFFEDLVVGIHYVWRARAFDGREYSDWSSDESFLIRDGRVIAVPGDLPTIQAAIEQALDNDTVMVSPGTYTENIDFLGKTIAVMSVNGAQSTFLQPAVPSSNTVRIAGGEGEGTILGGFTIQNGGYATTVLVQNESCPLIRDNIFRNNIPDVANPLTVIRADAPAVISRNLFYDNIGINVIYATGPAQIINNTIVSNERGIYAPNGSAVILNNIIADNVEYGLIEYAAVCDYNDVWNNGWENQGYNDPGPNGISENPLFTDAAGHDYTIVYASPCVDAGHPDEIYNDPDGTRNDMGAFPCAVVLPYPSQFTILDEQLLNVVSRTLTFDWQYLDTLLTEQTAYELEIGQDFDWTEAEVWASGIVTSNETSVVFDGEQLEDGMTYSCRLRVEGGGVWGDWAYLTFRMNTEPTVPELLYPTDLVEVRLTDVRLRVENSNDNEEDNLTYDFEVFDSPSSVTPVTSVTDVQEQDDSTSTDPIENLTGGGTYYWRARAFDGFEYSNWSDLTSFAVREPMVIRVPDDWATIQSAIDAALDDDTVLVMPGTYVENINFLGKTIVVMSQNGPASTFLQPFVASSSTVVLTSGEKEGTELNGFTVEQGGDAFTVEILNNSRPTVANNIFRNNMLGGATDLHSVVYVNSSALVTRNLFYANGGTYTLYVTGSARVVNNTVVDNFRGINSTSYTATILNNIVVNNMEAGLIARGSTYDFNDVWGNGSYNNPGANGISMDPLFLSPLNRDYELTESSPCIDAGHPDAIYNDADGSRNDIGAYPRLIEYPLATALNLGDITVDHVCDHIPTFYWSFEDTTDADQVAYRLEVGRDTVWTNDEMWITGEITSSDTFAVYDGIALEDGQSYYWRVQVYNGVDWGGWTTRSFRMNTIPSVPVRSWPEEGGTVHYEMVLLIVKNSTDNEGDARTYDFELYSDEGLTTLAGSQSAVDEGDDVTISSLFTGLTPESQYWWRVRASDGYELSEWSPTWSFHARGPGIIFVPQDGPTTIQAAIELAGPKDTVMVSPGTYAENINFLGKQLVVTSSDGPEYTIIESVVDTVAVVTIWDGAPKGTEISGFTITGGHQFGVDCELSSPLICNNIITNNGNASYFYSSGVILFNTTNAVVRDNCIVSNAGRAMYVAGCIGDTVCYNVTSNNETPSDVWLRSSSACVYNNTIHNANTIGISVTNCDVIEVRNNLVVGASDIGIYSENGSLIPRYNAVWDCPQLYGGNGISNPIGTVTDNPMLVDPDGGDFSLLTGSPCVDAGDPDADYLDPDGTRNDIGAVPCHLTFPVPMPLTFGDEDGFHLVNHNPTVSWTYRDIVEAEQQGFQIEVGTDHDWTEAEIISQFGRFVDNTTLQTGDALVDGATYYVRARVTGGKSWGTWIERIFHMNAPPTAPEPLRPYTYEEVHPNHVPLEVGNATDVESDQLTYDFEIYEDPELTVLFAVESQVFEQDETTISSPFKGLSSNTTYWWRARAYDGYEPSDWSEVSHFTTITAGIINVPGDQYTIQAGIDAAKDGDTVLVAAGTYAENIDFIGKSITVLSLAGPASTILEPEDNGQPTVQFVSGESSATELTGFTIQGATIASAVYIEGSSPTIQRNVFYNNHEGDISGFTTLRVMPGDISPVIRYNLFNDNGGPANVYLEAPALFHNNTIAFPDRAGLIVTDINAVIKNNVFYGCPVFAVSNAAAYSAIIDYNFYYNNAQDYEQGEPGPHDLHTDPLFVNADADEFHLKPISPCVDAGDPDPAFNDPDGSRNDVGAYPLDLAYPVPGSQQIGENEDQVYVLNHRPTIYWSYLDNSESYQTAFEVEVGLDSNWTVAEMWQSGQIISPDTFCVYDGAMLEDGLTYFYRIRVASGDRWGSWQTNVFRMNSLPTVPVLYEPINGASVITSEITLGVENSSDYESSVVSYDFEVFDTPTPGVTVWAEYEVAAQETATYSDTITGLSIGVDYWWRTRAFDGYEYSEWSNLESFVTRGGAVIRVPEDEPTIQSGIDLAIDADTVLVAPGSYIENIDFLGKRVVVVSSGGAEVTFLSPAVASQSTVLIDKGENRGAYLGDFTISGGGDVSTIMIANESRPTITDNIFHGNIPGGVINPLAVIRAAAPALVMRNIFYDNGGVAAIYASDSASVINNTVVFNTRGIYMANGSAAAINNIIAYNDGYGIMEYIETVEYNYTWLNGSYNDPGLYGDNVDPQFADPDARDFRLAFSSPCIDAGNPDPMYNDPDGTRNDAGALPFTPSTGYSALLIPDPLHTYAALAEDPGPGQIIAGDLPDGITAAEVDLNSLTINGSIPSASATVLSGYSGFTGEVVDIYFELEAFVRCYPILCDATKVHTFTVSGQCLSGKPFIVESEFTLVGYISGDINADGGVDISDLQYLVDYAFHGGPPPRPIEAADVNNDGRADVADLLFLINRAFGTNTKTATPNTPATGLESLSTEARDDEIIVQPVKGRKLLD